MEITPAVYRSRAQKLLYDMIISMVVDAEGKKRPSNDAPNPITLKRKAREHLREFRNWPVYVRGINCGMEFPNEAQVERYLKHGMVDKRRKFHIIMDKAEKRRGTVGKPAA